jgi:hypothetical protein
MVYRLRPTARHNGVALDTHQDIYRNDPVIEVATGKVSRSVEHYRRMTPAQKRARCRQIYQRRLATRREMRAGKIG